VPDAVEETIREENRSLRVELDALRAENALLVEKSASQAGDIETLTRRIAALEKRLGKNSENSSLPPSSDLFGPKKDKPENANRAARRALGRKPGKQPGAEGKLRIPANSATRSG